MRRLTSTPNKPILFRVKLFHLSDYSDVFGTIETREEHNAYQNIIVRQNLESG